MKNIYHCRLVPLILSVVTLVSQGASASSNHGVLEPRKTAAEPERGERVHRFALIVANNHSLDQTVAPLSYADDDGAKYFELMTALGATVELLTVLDSNAQQRYPEVHAAAKAPKRATLLQSLGELFSKIRSIQSTGGVAHFYFIYAGHGHLGPNREGYINLLDAPFTRADLYREVLGRSPADFNHLFLDACNAYYFVNKRGGGTDKRGEYTDQISAFLKTEELANYPNTGVLLAMSRELETHEWSRWESGIFSHEVRSALLGAADVNRDGEITYQEVAACVHAANYAVEIPKARLKVVYRPPAQDTQVSLVSLAELNAVAQLTLDGDRAGHYRIEDSRGIAIADFHHSSEQAVTLHAIGTAPIYLRYGSHELRLARGDRVEIDAQTPFAPMEFASRGSVEASFRDHLYKLPFGIGFYRGMVSMRRPGLESLAAVGPDESTKSNPPKPIVKIETTSVAASNRIDFESPHFWGWSSLTLGGLVGIASGAFYIAAMQSYDDYKNSQVPDEITEFKESTQGRMRASGILLGTGSTLVLTGAVLLLVHRRTNASLDIAAIRPTLLADSTGIFPGVIGRF